MKKIIILKGLPASGKSTWARDEVKAHPNMYKRINKDDMRAMLDSGVTRLDLRVCRSIMAIFSKKN